MATTFVEFTGDGNATKAFSFPSVQESDIKVTVNGTTKSSGTHYNITSYTTTGGGNVVFTSGNIPASPALIRIFRDTDLESAAATYTAGASVKAEDLNANQKQLLFHAQEEQNQLEQTANIRDDAIVTSKILDDSVTMAKLGSGALPTDITVASANIVDGTIVEADLANSAVTQNKLANNSVTSAKIVDGTIVNADISSSAAIDASKIVAATPSVAGTMASADKAKLDGIETAATADQTAAEIRTLVESATDSNVFTDADHTKLNAIEAGATADQTNAEIRTAVEAATDSNVFTDADHTKLNGIETSATADQTDAEIKTAYENNSNTNAFTDAEKTKLSGIATGADVTSSNSINALTDVNTAGAADGKILKYQASSSSFIIADDGGSGGGGSSTFTGLSDTPANFGSAAGKTLKVNSGGNAIEFVTVTTPTQDIVDDTTPQLGGNLDVQTNQITTSTTNGNIKVNPNGTGCLEVLGDGTSSGTVGAIQLNCSNNNHGVKIQSPPHSASASYTLTLPNNDGNNGQFLSTNGSGVLSFANSPTIQALMYPNGNSAVLTSTNNVVEINGKVNWDNDPNNTYGISFDAPTTLTKDSNFTLPEDGSNGQFLKTNGSGVLSFGTIDLTALSATNLTSGTIPDARFPATLPAASGANLTNLDASDLASGTIPDARFPATLPAVSGANLTNLPVSPYNIQINTISSYSGTGGNSATFNGSAYRFVLSNAGANAQAHLVSINGVVQKPNSGTSQPSEGFAIDGTSIIFSSAPPSGADFFILTLGTAVNIGTPSDGTVTNNKIADDTISEAKLDIHAAPSGTDKVLGYTANGMEWVTAAAGATGGGTDKIFYENGQTVTTNYTITNNTNAMSAGPITISGSSTVVTIGTGENWTIV